MASFIINNLGFKGQEQDQKPPDAAVKAEQALEALDACTENIMDSFKAWFPAAEEYCNLISAFGFDKAKQLAEKHKDEQNADLDRATLLNLMAQLAVNEKMYSNLGFMNVVRTMLFRKDQNVLKTNYSNVCSQFGKLMESSTSSIQVQEIASHLQQFAYARLDMIEFYEVLANAGTKAAEVTYTAAKQLKDPEKLDGGIKDIINSTLMPLEKSVLEKLTALESKFSNFLGETGFKRLACGLNWELSILANLIRTLHFMDYWDFVNSSIMLARARKGLCGWEQFCNENYRAPSSPVASRRLFERFKLSSPSSSATNNTQETPSSLSPSAAAPQKSDPMMDWPLMFVWLLKLRDAVLTKYTLYFYEQLSAKEEPKDMEDYCQDSLPVSIIKTIQDFQKTMGAPYVTFIYNATGDSTFRGKCLLERERENAGSCFSSPSDLDLYHPVFTSSMMAKPNSEGGGAPFFTLRSSSDVKESHLQTMVKGMQDDVWELAMPYSVQHFYNCDFNFTYYIMRVDLCMVCAVIFDSKRRDKDPRVTYFLMDVSAQLRCCKNFASLRSLGLKP